MSRRTLFSILSFAIFLTSLGACTEENKNKEPPVLNSVPPATAAEGTPYPYPIDCTDPDGNVLTLTIGEQDTCGGVIGTPGEDPSYEWTPDENAGGTTCVLHVVCDDGKHAVEQTQEITIAETNQAPVFVDVPASGATHLETVGTLALAASDADLPAQNLSFTIDATACPFLVELGENHELQWTCGAVVEDCTVTATVTDDGSPVLQATAEIVLGCENGAPVFESTPVTTVNEGETYVYQLECSDPDADPVMLSIDDLDTCFGLLETYAEGLASSTFDTYETDGGSSCTASFACHDVYGGFSVQTFTVDIVDTNSPPMITNLPASIQTMAEAAGSKWVTAMDPDDPAQTLTWSVLASSCFFASTISSDGVASWICGDLETCEFTIRVIDDGMPVMNDTQTLQITCYLN